MSIYHCSRQGDDVAQNIFDNTRLLPEKPDAGLASLCLNFRSGYDQNFWYGYCLIWISLYRKCLLFEDLVLKMFLLLSQRNRRLPGKWDSIDFFNK